MESTAPMRGESGSEHNGDIRSKLSDEARGRLDALAIDCLAAVREAFRDYARKIHATEWASYDDGETEQFIECFTPMARDLVAAYLKEFTGISNDLSPWMARNVLNLSREQPARLPCFRQLIRGGSLNCLRSRRFETPCIL